MNEKKHAIISIAIIIIATAFVIIAVFENLNKVTRIYVSLIYLSIMLITVVMHIKRRLLLKKRSNYSNDK